MKSILRILKKFILFILMIVFPISNFAAVSVSDGSSFVSKAEFNSSLNNMSNRIAIIENTLDSKIDSLVSSYLSRNGIWNGDKQKLESTTYWNVGIKDITLSGGNYATSETLIDNKVINKISKSGLLVGFVYYTDGKRDQLNQNTSRWGYYLTYLGTNYFRSDSGIVLYLSMSEQISSAKTIKYSNVIASSFSQLYLNQGDVASTMGAVLGISLPATEIIYPISFFVSKDSSIYISLGMDIHIRFCEKVTNMEHAIRVGVKDEFYVY